MRHASNAASPPSLPQTVGLEDITFAPFLPVTVNYGFHSTYDNAASNEARALAASLPESVESSDVKFELARIGLNSPSYRGEHYEVRGGL